MKTRRMILGCFILLALVLTTGFLESPAMAVDPAARTPRLTKTRPPTKTKRPTKTPHRPQPLWTQTAIRPSNPLFETSVIYDLVVNANLAHWMSGAGDIPWAYSDTDRRGFALNRDSVRMEDGSAYDLVLETHPQWVDHGRIEGIFLDMYYSGYVIDRRDTFVAVVGFLENANAGEATFRVMIQPGDGPNEWIGKVKDTYDGKLKGIAIPLSRWAGQRANFVITVDAGSVSTQDWATWVVAQIQRAE